MIVGWRDVVSDNLCVVTGASAGIGAAYAARLAARGRDLLLVARRADRLDALAARLKGEFGVAVEALAADLCDPAALQALAARLEQAPPAMLVNNAGAGEFGPVAARGADVQQRLIDLNIVALVRLSIAALSGFSRLGRGALVNMASVVAFLPTGGSASYAGSKAFVLNFTRALQMEYMASNIRIQAVLPGPINTELFRSQGMDASFVPDSAFISAEALVDAALAGFDAGEEITMPTLVDESIWADMETLRTRFAADIFGGRVAPRYAR